MISGETPVYLAMALASVLSTIATYMAVKERDLIRAVVYSALQSGFYSILYYLLAAPDIVLVYIPVAVGLVPGVLIVLISKTERWEKE
ncbi:MAG: Na(+)/H(+) antiporter subunit B [Desulfurococcaceae archaeon]